MLDGASQFAATDDRGAVRCGTNGGMNLPQVHAHHTAFCENGCFEAILDHKIPFIRTRLTIVHQARFFDLCLLLLCKRCGQGDKQVLSVGECKADLVGLALDLAGFEEGAAKTLALVGETSACVLFAKFAGGLGGLVETLLCGVDAVGMKDGIRFGEGIIDALGLRGGHPDAVFAIKAPMTDKDTVVHLSTCAVESVENVSFLRGGCCPCENHLCTLVLTTQPFAWGILNKENTTQTLSNLQLFFQ